MLPGKRPIFWVALIQAVVSKTLRLFYKTFFCLQNVDFMKRVGASYTLYIFTIYPSTQNTQYTNS